MDQEEGLCNCQEPCPNCSINQNRNFRRISIPISFIGNSNASNENKLLLRYALMLSLIMLDNNADNVQDVKDEIFLRHCD